MDFNVKLSMPQLAIVSNRHAAKKLCKPDTKDLKERTNILIGISE